MEVDEPTKARVLTAKWMPYLWTTKKTYLLFIIFFLCLFLKYFVQFLVVIIVM